MNDTKYIISKMNQLKISWYKLAKSLNFPMKTVYRWKNGGKISPLYEEKVLALLSQTENEQNKL